MNARLGRLLDDMKDLTTGTEIGLKEIGQDFSQFREELNSEEAICQNKAGQRERDKVNDSVRLGEERFAGLVEDKVTEIQTAAQNSIQKVNTEIKNLQEQLPARQLTDSAIPNQVLPVMAGDAGNSI